MADRLISIRSELAVYAIGTFCFSTQQMLPIALGILLVAMDTPVYLIGIVLGSREFASVLFSIHGGALMDRFGARRVAIICTAAAAVAPLFFPAATIYIFLILLQAVNGFANNMGWLGAQTLIGQVMGGDPSYSGRLTFSIRIGILSGPPLTGLVYDLWGPWGGFTFIALWGLGALVGALSLPVAEQERTEMPRPRLKDCLPKLSDYRETFALLRTPMVFFVTSISMLIVMTTGVQQSFYVVFLNANGYSGTEIGILFAVTAILGGVGALTLGQLLRLFNPTLLLLATGMCSVTLICSTPIWGSFTALFMVSALRGGVAGINQPLMITLMAKAVGGREQGKAVALRSTANRITHIIVPMFMGGIAEFIGIANSFYVVGGVVLAMIAMLGLYVWRSPEVSGR